MRQVGRYEVIHELGRGGMGVVYLAQDTLLKRQVAIKTVVRVQSQDEPISDDTVRRFIREAQSAASLNHPNLVATYDVISDGDLHSIVMEYVKGKNLGQVFPLGTFAPPNTVLGVLRQAASGLDYAHSHGIVHRDIKPANILLDDAHVVKIADFGLAKPLNSGTDLSHGLAVGTLEYMSPEQLEAQPVSGQTDQYALAVVTYRMLTGCRIFDAETAGAWCSMIVQKTPLPASQRNPALPRAVDDVLARAMSKAPKARFNSCHQFVLELEHALQTSGSGLRSVSDSQITRTMTAVQPSGRMDRSWREVAGRRKAIGASIGILTLAGAGWFVVARPHGGTVPERAVSVAGPDGMSVHIGSSECVTPKCALHLAPGTYSLIASKDGYEGLKQPLTVKPGEDVTVPLALAPLPETVQVNTNFSSGTVRLDARRVGSLVNGAFSISGIGAGEHVIEVTGSGADFKAQWRSQSGAAPTLLGRMEAKDLEATVISSAGKKGTIATNGNPQSVKIDGTPVGYTHRPEAAAEEISLVGEGVRKLELGDRVTFLEVRGNPTLTLLLELNRNVGTPVVDTKKVPVTRTQAQGILTITGLAHGEEVSIDGRVRGVAGPSRTVRYDDLPVGEHTLDVARDGYKPVRQDFQITDGGTTNVDGTKFVLTKNDAPPAPPDPAAIEARDWDRLRTSNSVDDLQNFVRQHPGGLHTDEARNRINQLAQAQRKDAEEKALREQESAWIAVDKTKRASLQDFITRYGNSIHAPEARTLQNGIEKKEADELTAQRASELKAHDQEAVMQTLRRYESAFSEKNIGELQTVWAITAVEAKKINDQFRNARTFQVKLTLNSPVTIIGDSASVECVRVVSVIPANGPAKPISNRDRVRITLIRSGATWLIRAITPLENHL